MIAHCLLGGLLMWPSLMVSLSAKELLVYGGHERVHLVDLGQILNAKMDTGALTSSLSARDIQLFQRDAKAWVRFRLALHGQETALYEHPLVRISQIKRRQEEQPEADHFAQPKSVPRPVIQLRLCLGEQMRWVEVNLADRRHFSYPLLIGARAIQQWGAAIDPAQRYVAGLPHCG